MVRKMPGIIIQFIHDDFAQAITAAAVAKKNTDQSIRKIATIFIRKIFEIYDLMCDIKLIALTFATHRSDL